MTLTTVQFYIVCEIALAAIIGWSIIVHVLGDLYGHDFFSTSTALLIFIGSLGMGALIIGMLSTIKGILDMHWILQMAVMIVAGIIGLAIYLGSLKIIDALKKKIKEAESEKHLYEIDREMLASKKKELEEQLEKWRL